MHFRVSTLLSGLFIITMILNGGCVQTSENNEIDVRTEKDIDNAITVIESRRESEYRLIEDQSRLIENLEGNIEKSNSDGMKDKIRNDIGTKRLAIVKAKRNIENQNLILGQLEQKRDSLLGEQ